MINIIPHYLRAAACLYGRIRLGTLYAIFTHHNGGSVSLDLFCQTALQAQSPIEPFRIIGDDDIYRGDISVPPPERLVVHKQYCYATWDELFTLECSHKDKAIHLFPRQTFLNYANPDYVPDLPQVQSLRYMLQQHTQNKVPFEQILRNALLLAQNDYDAPSFLQEMQRLGCKFGNLEDRLLSAYCYKGIYDTIPKPVHNGNSELELHTLPIARKPLKRYYLWFCPPDEDDGFHLFADRLKEDVPYTGITELQRFLDRCMTSHSLPSRLYDPCFCGSGLYYTDCCGKR